MSATNRNLTLAAVASAALPALEITGVRPMSRLGSDFDVASVQAADGSEWIVRAPRDATAGASQEAEIELLRQLAPHVSKGGLPFKVPNPESFVSLKSGGRAMVYRQLKGRPLELESIAAGPGIATALGHSIAALHELPITIVDNAGLPSYQPEEYRIRLQAEVDEASRSGFVPNRLQQRWEEMLENVSLWRFRPTLIHGDLVGEHILTNAGTISAMINFSKAQASDPAEDLATLLSLCTPEAGETILDSYSRARHQFNDDHLGDRAMLLGEMAVVRWLLFGLRSHDQEVIDDARTMLKDLDSAVAQAALEESHSDDDDSATDTGTESLGLPR